MTMTPWNLTMATDILKSAAPWSRSKWLFCGQTSWLDQRSTILAIRNLYYVHGHGQNWCFFVDFHGKILG